MKEFNLLECPFCHGKPHIEIDHETMSAFTVCGYCGAGTDKKHFSILPYIVKSVAEDWNTKYYEQAELHRFKSVNGSLQSAIYVNKQEILWMPREKEKELIELWERLPDSKKHPLVNVGDDELYLSQEE